MSKTFQFFAQHDLMDCGTACLRMVASHHGRHYSMEYLRALSSQHREGVSIGDLAGAAEVLGLRATEATIDWSRPSQQVPLPLIASFGHGKFAVVYKIKGEQIWMADPGSGKKRVNKVDFLKWWGRAGEQMPALILEVTPDFYLQESGVAKKPTAWHSLKSYFSRFKSLLWQLGASVLLSILLQLAFPFILQAVVDYGIARDNLDLIWMLLLAHFLVFVGRLSVDVLRDWLVLHIGERVNIQLMSDFLFRLMRMPMQFFESRHRGDVFRRLSDSGHLEKFFRRTFLIAAISVGQLMMFAVVLLIYSPFILLVFFGGVASYAIWANLWWNKRAQLAAELDAGSDSASTKVEEMIEGIGDLRTYGAGKSRQWQWAQAQSGLFKLRIKARKHEQWIQVGGALIEELTLLIVLYIASVAVIDGSLTLGMLIAIISVIGQMSAPVRQLLHFVQQFRETGTRVERIREILKHDPMADVPKVELMPVRAGIFFDNVGFSYGNSGRPTVFENFQAKIPYGKRTAITGESGAGKSTLLKLLVNQYAPTAGRIRLEEVDMNTLREEVWYQRCGVVMDSSRLFTDTIVRNITLGEQQIDYTQLSNAVRIARLSPLLDQLPQGMETVIGPDGAGLSQGQMQQILLARLTYSNPEYIFLDEATSALDPFSEMIIWDGICDYFEGKTVVFASRQINQLKTADHIIVLQDGEVVEQGTHRELLSKDGFYTFTFRTQMA